MFAILSTQARSTAYHQGLNQGFTYSQKKKEKTLNINAPFWCQDWLVGSFDWNGECQGKHLGVRANMDFETEFGLAGHVKIKCMTITKSQT